MRTVAVHARHRQLVAAWREVFREAGHPIQNRNVERLVRDTNLRSDPDDLRRLDLVCSGLPGVFEGKPLFMDATCVSPVHGDGRPMPRAHRENGAALSAKDNVTRETDYPDINRSPHAQLLSLSVETYGR